MILSQDTSLQGVAAIISAIAVLIGGIIAYKRLSSEIHNSEESTAKMVTDSTLAATKQFQDRMQADNEMKAAEIRELKKEIARLEEANSTLRAEVATLRDEIRMLKRGEKS